MKKFILAMCLSMAALMMVAPAFATELWDPHLRMSDEGLASGALPPPGLYFIDTFYCGPDYHFYGNSPVALGNPGKANPDFKIFADVYVPVLLWVPGCSFLGATYAMALGQPFDYTNLKAYKTPGGLAETGSKWGTFGTIVVPYSLSWKLPCDFYVKQAFAVTIDDASSYPGQPQTGGVYAPNGNGYWSFSPSVGISYLHAGWNISGEFFFAFNTKNNSTDYRSGNQFAADYTATYTCNKWTFGLGAAQENQLERDTNEITGKRNVRAEAYLFGPILGYNFGPCSLMGVYNFPISINDDVGGEVFELRLVVPLGNPCPL